MQKYKIILAIVAAVAIIVTVIGLASAQTPTQTPNAAPNNGAWGYMQTWMQNCFNYMHSQFGSQSPNQATPGYNGYGPCWNR
jgi:hypothetical protein